MYAGSLHVSTLILVCDLMLCCKLNFHLKCSQRKYKIVPCWIFELVLPKYTAQKMKGTPDLHSVTSSQLSFQFVFLCFFFCFFFTTQLDPGPSIWTMMSFYKFVFIQHHNGFEMNKAEKNTLSLHLNCFKRFYKKKKKKNHHLGNAPILSKHFQGLKGVLTTERKLISQMWSIPSLCQDKWSS